MLGSFRIGLLQNGCSKSRCRRSGRSSRQGLRSSSTSLPTPNQTPDPARDSNQISPILGLLQGCFDPGGCAG
eukprot:2379034-Amphidinium_carterae.1